MKRDLTLPLVTGGAGFIGSTLCRQLLARPELKRLMVVDKLTYAGSRDNLPDDPRIVFAEIVIADKHALSEVIEDIEPTCVFNLAAESHVDRSIEDANDFIQTNIVGTANLIELCRQHGLPLIQVSTDEVYGSVNTPDLFTEESPLAPSSPYSASKASADLLCQAAHRTHGQDIVITRCSNNYGAHQFPEKLIPVIVRAALSDQPLPVYGDGLNVRDWIHVDDHCSALILAAEKGHSGEVYNIGSSCEKTNLEVVKLILDTLGKPHSLIKFVEDRKGHDRRYAIDSSKAQRELDWTPQHEFESSFPEVVRQITKS